jgi:hypothetical protein
MMIADDALWERLWAPYDDNTYAHVLELIPAGATVLDIGAGDLRLAKRIASLARLVYAIENQAALLDDVSVPENVRLIYGDARATPFPGGIDVAVLLMRHCTWIGLCLEKLAAAGCPRLITNARWRMGVELIDLTLEPSAYNELTIGWYACRCGATGFRPGQPEQLTILVAESVTEVNRCPQCQRRGRQHHGWNRRRLT